MGGGFFSVSFGVFRCLFPQLRNLPVKAGPNDCALLTVPR